MTSNDNIRQIRDVINDVRERKQKISAREVYDDPKRKQAIENKAKALSADPVDLRSGLEGELDKAAAKIRLIEYRVDNIENKDASTKAHARIAKLENQLREGLEVANSTLTALDERIDRLGGSMGDTQASAFSKEISRVAERVDKLWEDLDRGFYELKERVDLLADSHEETSKTVDGIEYAMKSDETIVEIRENEDKGLIGLAIFVGVVAGIIAGFTANNIFDDWGANRIITFGVLLGIAAALFISSIKSGDAIAVGKIKWAERKPTTEHEPTADDSEAKATPSTEVVVVHRQEEVDA